MKEYKLSKYNIYHEEPYFVANTFTGSEMQMEKEEYFAVKNLQLDYFDNKTVMMLEEAGIIVESSCNELQLVLDAYHTCKYDRGNKNKHMQVTIAPSLFCNFNCPYCYERRTTARMSREILQQTYLFIEERVKKSRISDLNICWYGGEPLLQMKMIEQLSKMLISFCESRGVEYQASMITNGYCVTEEVAEQLVRLKVNKMQITIDGDKETHDQRRILANGKGTYDVIEKNIFLLADRGIQVAVRVNLDKSNIEKYKEVTKVFAEKENISCYPAVVTVEDTQGASQKNLCYTHSERGLFYNKIYELADTKCKECLCANFGPGVCNCSAEHVNSFVIGPEGDIFKCLNDICDKECAVGHVSMEVVKNETWKKYVERNLLLETECMECPYLPMCYGGCVYEYEKHGSHACKAVKYLYEKNILEKMMSNS